LDSEGDIDLGGPRKARAVWDAMALAVEGPELVAEALRSEASGPVLNLGGVPASTAAPLINLSPVDAPPERWQTLNASGESSAAQAPPAPPTPGRQRLPPAPRHMGMPVLSPAGQGYIARRNAARFKGEPFTELPPHDLSPFGYSNEP
jgi:hypothetical protein